MLRSISFVITPPLVSIPRVSGVTSSSSTSLTSPASTPAWIAGADRDHLVGVDALVGVLAGQLLDPLANRRHPGHAADQDHVVDRGVAGVVERPFDRADDPLQQVGGQLV